MYSKFPFDSNYPISNYLTTQLVTQWGLDYPINIIPLQSTTNFNCSILEYIDPFVN